MYECLIPPCANIVVASPEFKNLNGGWPVSDQWPAIHIPLPPIEEQNDIVSVITAADKELH